MPLVACLPVYGVIAHTLDQLDPRPADSWRDPKERNLLLMRNATSTRHDYEGQGVMSALAKYLMRTAAAKGFKTVNIECVNDRVTVGSENSPKVTRCANSAPLACLGEPTEAFSRRGRC